MRIRPATVASPRLLVMIHGWTGDENSMWVFARRFSEQYWIIAPRAPHPADPQGFSWRPPQDVYKRQVQGYNSKRDMDHLLHALEKLLSK